MNIILGVVSLLLLVGLWIERTRRQTLIKELKYIHTKLEQIMEEDTNERIRVVTMNPETKVLLSTINTLLDHNHQNHVKYNKSKTSMKKMLSNISHDLKTPLTVVLGYLEMLSLKYKEEENIEKVYEKVKEVLALINKFFDLAKLESGDKQLHMEKLDLCEICRMALLDYYRTLENNAYEVELQIPDVPLYILGDREALKRILNNLISNAIHYGDLGKYLGLCVREENEHIIVEVIDKGKGIKEQYKEEVFERMYTLEDSRSKAYQGSGLGLTITKELVEKMGGEIHLDSEPFVKTVFSFWLNKLTY